MQQYSPNSSPNLDYRVRLSALPLLLLALPMAEIATFVLVGREIGVLATLGLIVATSIAGAVLLRIQGFGLIRRIRAALEAGQTPGRDLVHGMMILVAGILLVLPGFLTDILGFLLFVPPLRDIGWRFVRDRIVVTEIRTAGPGRPRGGPNDGVVDLDADDYHDISPGPVRPDGGRIDPPR